MVASALVQRGAATIGHDAHLDMPTKCEVGCDIRNPGHTRLEVTGEFVRGSSAVGADPQSGAFITATKAAQTRGLPILVDLREATRMDEDGRAAILFSRRLCSGKQVEMLLIVRPDQREAFEAAQLHKALKLFDDPESALSSMKK